MRRFRFLLVLVMAASASGPAFADSPRVEPLRQPTMQQYGADNTDCVEWSNACQICKRDADGAAQCSTPGIACTPGRILCKVKR